MINKRLIDVIFVIVYTCFIVGTNTNQQGLKIGMVSSTAPTSDQIDNEPISLIQLQELAEDSAPVSISSNSVSLNSTIDDCDDSKNVTVGANCFFDTVNGMINRLDQTIKIYLKLCSLESKPRLARFHSLAQLLGYVSGYSTQNVNRPPGFESTISLLGTFPEFKFSNYLRELQQSFQVDVDRKRLLTTLWSSISDELDRIIREQNYPFFLRTNTWHLLQNVKISNFLKFSNHGNLTRCIDKSWTDVIQLYEVTSHPNFISIFRPITKVEVCKTDATIVDVLPEIFTNGGIVVTFWAHEDATILQNGKVSLFTGYISNSLTYEYTLELVIKNLNEESVNHTFRIGNVIYFLILANFHL